MIMTHELRGEMAASIARRIPDPSGWLLEVRRIAEVLHLDVTRAVMVGTGSLQLVCHHLLEEAAKQGRSPEQIRRAIEPD
jgi:hypothetical protein